MKKELLKAPKRAPKGMHPFNMPEAGPVSRSISYIFLRVSISMLPR